LIEAGADPNSRVGERNPMQTLVRNLEWGLDASFGGRDTHAALECLKIAAAAGGRWRPNEPYQLRCFRKAIGKAPEYSAVQWVNQLINCGAIDQGVFAEVMKTPRMRQLLRDSAPGTLRLREFAGVTPPRSKLRR
jgi:hypothetical protein